jgi:Protein of unknown function/Domain of unknown function (DUF1835)
VLDLAECLHVCTGDSASGSVREMLRLVTGTRSIPLVCSNMLENAGPLNLLDKPKARLEWFSSCGFDAHMYMGFIDEGPEQLVKGWQAFWTEIDEWPGPFALWFSSLNAWDSSLILAIANRLSAARSVFLVDVAEPQNNISSVSDVGELRPLDLKPWAEYLSGATASSLDGLRAQSASLSTMNDALRVFIDGRLATAPVEGLDASILSVFSTKWAPLSRSVARIPNAWGIGDHRDLNYTWLLWRVDELERAGRIERRNGKFDPHFRDDPFKGEVRLSV